MTALAEILTAEWTSTDRIDALLIPIGEQSVGRTSNRGARQQFIELLENLSGSTTRLNVFLRHAEREMLDSKSNRIAPLRQWLATAETIYGLGQKTLMLQGEHASLLAVDQDYDDLISIALNIRTHVLSIVETIRQASFSVHHWKVPTPQVSATREQVLGALLGVMQEADLLRHDAARAPNAVDRSLSVLGDGGATAFIAEQTVRRAVLAHRSSLYLSLEKALSVLAARIDLGIERVQQR